MKSIVGRIVVTFLVAALWAPVQAQSSRELAGVRSLAAAGAVDLALERIEHHQPRQSADPGWGEWEILRLELLLRTRRYADILARVERAAGQAQNVRVSAALLNTAARAAMQLGRAAEARTMLARSFLLAETGTDEYRAARVATIDSYLQQGLVDAAYLAMLRFRQDFSPLHGAEVEGFVAGLIAAGRIDEAAGWLTQLDADSPRGALLRLRAGLIAPAAAMAHARALLSKGAAEPAWALLAAAGRAQNDPEIELEIMEGRMNASAAEHGSQPSEQLAALWRAYAQVAERAANQAHLLAGDDAAWAQEANRIHESRPRAARALLALLATNPRSSELRTRARLQVLASLREAGLARSAWVLFSDTGRFPLGELDSQLRFELGSLAAEVGEAAAGVRFWQGLPPMAGMSTAQWQARQLVLLLQAGMHAEAISNARSLVHSKTPLDAEAVHTVALAARDALEFGHAETARIIYQALLPHAAAAQRMAIYSGLGKAHESSGDYRAAAYAYLLAAAASKEPGSDPEALAARAAAGISLVRAGLRDDARRVFDWLARNARPAEVRQAAARRLSRL